MSDIFYEIEEAIKRDRLIAIWQKSRIALAAIVIAIIFASAIYSFLDSRKVSRQKEDYIIYSKALVFLNDKQNEDALQLFDYIIIRNRSSYAKIARMMKINCLLLMQKNTEALNEVAYFNSYSKDIRDFLLSCFVLSANSNINVLSKIVDAKNNPCAVLSSRICALSILSSTNALSEDKRQEIVKLMPELRYGLIDEMILSAAVISHSELK
jgi:flagellar basal body-associated protein FliL